MMSCERAYELMEAREYRVFWGINTKGFYIVPMLYLGFSFGFEIIQCGIIISVGPICIGLGKILKTPKDN